MSIHKNDLVPGYYFKPFKLQLVDFGPATHRLRLLMPALRLDSDLFDFGQRHEEGVMSMALDVMRCFHLDCPDFDDCLLDEDDEAVLKEQVHLTLMDKAAVVLIHLRTKQN